MTRGLLAIAVGLFVVSCFYDSRWGEAKRAQKNAAAHATPAALSTAPLADDDTARAPSRTLRVRLRATSQYAAQTVDWQRQVRDLVDDANRVLAPAVAAKLEIASMDAWSPAPPDGTLDAYITTLAASDRATDVDLVIGLVGSIPRHTDSFHDVGLAVVLGKHAVVRAAQSAADYDSIEKGLDELSAEERKRLRNDNERQKHRALAVFLHEIGHTFGAIHEASPTSLMHPTYRSTMSAFSDDGALLMRMALGHRGEADPRLLANDLIVRIEAAPPGTWIAKDRDDALARLRATAAREPATTASNDADAAAAPDPLASLSPDDRATYARADAAFQKNHVDEAWKLARPLFDAYPNVYAVQDFRCQLATLRGLDAAKVKPECARMIELLRDKRDGR